MQAHLQRHSARNRERVTFQSENVELTNLLSIRDLARKLLASDLETLDAVICNAGMGGWTGIDWVRAIPSMLADFRNNTVWPSFKLGAVGAITKPQLPNAVLSEPEPPLGEIFCANLFGHYMLVHWLMPLLRMKSFEDPCKIIWVSSIEPQGYHFHEKDFQGLKTDAPYEHSKRLTDLLSLSANQPAALASKVSFTTPDASLTKGSLSRSIGYSTPSMHVYHPGIVVTSVISLVWIVQYAYLLGIYIARWIGSPWSTVEPYTAAHGASWLALASEKEISQAENAVLQQNAVEPVARSGRVKWGTAVTFGGTSSVRATEVDKWGINGSGAGYVSTWWNGSSGRGRKPGAVEAKPEDVEHFVAQGARAWKEMESLREQWERRIFQAEHRK